MLEAFETWTWRQMESLSRLDNMINDKVLEKIGKDHSIMHTISKRLLSTLLQSGPKSKPLLNDQKVVLDRIIACQ